jgi:hypothetical protein
MRAKFIYESYDWDKDKVAGEKIIPNRFVYHISLPEFRKNIQEKGLIAGVGESYIGWARDSKNIIPAIFATNSFEIATHSMPSGFVDCWEIDTHKIDNEWFIDKHFNDLSFKNPHIVTFEDIKPNALKLIII